MEYGLTGPTMAVDLFYPDLPDPAPTDTLGIASCLTAKRFADSGPDAAPQPRKGLFARLFCR
jgi:hypothetical protein